MQSLFYSIHTHLLRGEGGENGCTAWTDLKEQILRARVMAYTRSPLHPPRLAYGQRAADPTYYRFREGLAETSMPQNRLAENLASARADGSFGVHCRLCQKSLGQRAATASSPPTAPPSWCRSKPSLAIKVVPHRCWLNTIIVHLKGKPESSLHAGLGHRKVNKQLEEVDLRHTLEMCSGCSVAGAESGEGRAIPAGTAG